MGEHAVNSAQLSLRIYCGLPKGHISLESVIITSTSRVQRATSIARYYCVVHRARKAASTRGRWPGDRESTGKFRRRWVERIQRGGRPSHSVEGAATAASRLTERQKLSHVPMSSSPRTRPSRAGEAVSTPRFARSPVAGTSAASIVPAGFPAPGSADEPAGTSFPVKRLQRIDAEPLAGEALLQLAFSASTLLSRKALENTAPPSCLFRRSEKVRSVRLRDEQRSASTNLVH